MLDTTTAELFDDDFHEISKRAARRYIQEYREGTVLPDETQAFLGEFWENMYSKYRVILDTDDVEKFEHLFKRECQLLGVSVDLS